MHLRRVLLLMAMILLVTAVVVAVVPPKRRQASGQVVLPPQPPRSGAAPRNVQLRFPPPKPVPESRMVQGDHAVITVTTAQAGEAVVMGLTGPAEPGTPATFDVLAPSPGRYAVTFSAEFGGPQRIATIDVAP